MFFPPTASLCASHNSFQFQAQFLLSSPSCCCTLVVILPFSHFPILPLPHYHIPTLSHFIPPAPSGHSAAIRPPLGRRASLVVVRWFSLLTVLRRSPRDARAASCDRFAARLRLGLPSASLRRISLSFARGLCGGLDSSSPAVCGGSERSLVRFRLGSRLASTNDREKRNQPPRRRQSCENRPSFVPLSSLARRGVWGSASHFLTRDHRFPPPRAAFCDTRPNFGCIVVKPRGAGALGFASPDPTKVWDHPPRARGPSCETRPRLGKFSRWPARAALIRPRSIGRPCFATGYFRFAPIAPNLRTIQRGGGDAVGLRLPKPSAAVSRLSRACRKTAALGFPPPAGVAPLQGVMDD